MVPFLDDGGSEAFSLLRKFNTSSTFFFSPFSSVLMVGSVHPSPSTGFSQETPLPFFFHDHPKGAFFFPSQE